MKRKWQRKRVWTQCKWTWFWFSCFYFIYRIMNCSSFMSWVLVAVSFYQKELKSTTILLTSSRLDFHFNNLKYMPKTIIRFCLVTYCCLNCMVMYTSTCGSLSWAVEKPTSTLRWWPEYNMWAFWKQAWKTNNSQRNIPEAWYKYFQYQTMSDPMG